MPWAPSYTEVADLAAYLRIDDPVDDVELALAITAASRAIDQATNRQFGVVAVAEERTYTARYDYERGQWVVDVDDYMADPVSVEVDGTPVTVFVKAPVNAAQKGRPWTRIEFTADSEATPTGCADEISVIDLWGWTAIPDTITQSALLQASRFHTRRNAPFGVAGSPDVGSEMRLLAKVDPDVEVALRNYRRTRSVG